MKILIYGFGQLFKSIEEKIKWTDVLAIVDEKAEKNQIYNGIPVYKPISIKNLSYDYIVICSSKYFRSIRRSLIGDYFIDEHKIISYYVWEEISELGNEEHEIIAHWINTTNSLKILDLGMNLEKNSAVCFEHIRKCGIKIDGIGKLENPLNRRLYYNYVNVGETIENEYDGIVYNEMTRDLSDIFAKYECKWCIYISRYSWETEMEEKNLELLLNKKCVRRIATLKRVIYYFVKKELIEEADIKNTQIYVVSHKNYNLLQDELYKPICVGKKPWTTKFISECDGDNIAEYNNRLNECTAMYWMWKNSQVKTIGLSHYRRYFYNDKLEYSANYLDKNHLKKIQDKGYDLILPELLTLEFKVAENIIKTVGQEVYDKAYEIVLDCMRKNQPDYVESLNRVLEGNQMYICNMFVMSKSNFDKYAEWLFSFIIEAADRLDITGFNNFQIRTIGYFAEIMMTCWIQKQNLKIYELPVTNVWLK